jgi:predicted transcriptional regulator
MSNERESPWCEVQLEQWRWANMPESAGLWAVAPPDDAAEARLRAEEELGLVLHALVVSVLTTQQRRVMELYFLDGLKQVEVARALGISQTTVSQHLSGKKRGSVHVGGALRKLRKAIHKAAKRRRMAATKTAQIIRVMDKLLDRSITRRRAKSLMDELAAINAAAANEKNIK